MPDLPSQDHGPEVREAAPSPRQRLLLRYRESGDSRLLHTLARLAREAGDLREARAFLLSERREIQAGDHARLAANAFEMACLAQLRQEINQALLYLRASLRYALLGADRAAELRARDLMAQLIPLLGEPRLAHVLAYLDAKGA